MNLWDYWPVLLILAGLDVLFGRRSFLGNLIVLLLTLVVIPAVYLVVPSKVRAETGQAIQDIVPATAEAAIEGAGT